MKAIIPSLLIAAAAVSSISIPAAASGAKSPYVSEIAPYVSPENRPASPSNMVYMPDGQSYLTFSDDRSAILRIDSKTGKQTEVFVDLATTRENTLPSADGFSISADASKVLIYRNPTPIYRRSFTAEYYVYEVRSRLLRPLSTEHPRQQSPIFSPNARMVAFVSDNNIFIKKLDYNTEVAVTEDGEYGKIINGVSDWTYEEEFAVTCSMDFSADNSTFCFVKYDESQVPVYTLPIYSGACKPDKRYALYPGTYSYKYPVAGEHNSRVTLHSYDVETRKIKDIALHDDKIEYIPSIHFTPTGTTLIVPTLNRDQNRLEIYSVNPKSTVVKSIYVETSDAWIEPCTYERLRYADDHFSVLSARSGYTHVYQYTYTGSELSQTTSGDYDVTAYYGADALGNHYFQAAAPTPLDRTIRCIDRKGTVRDISPATGWSSATFAPTFSYLTLVHSDAATPPSYKVCTTSGKEIRTIQDNAAYLSRYGALPRKEFITVTSDGAELNAYIIKPMGFDPTKRYPVIMTQYSGPGSQSVTNSWKMDFDTFYALKGYIVFCVDGRGTGARGRRFCDIVYKQLGHYETIDQTNAAAYLASLPYVDASRIAICGWSYGGYEALMCATEPQSPFAAAVAIAPVTDWRYYDTVYAERYMLTPGQNAEGYYASAPINRSRNLRCPLLIMYGTADDNVHPANSLEFVSRLQSQGLLCDMFVFPGMNHSINGCNARAIVYAKMLDFFDRNLK